MNVFLSQDFLTVIHDMKFPGHQKFPFFTGIPGLFTGMPLRTIISVITPSLSAIRLQGEVLLLISFWIIPSRILRIRRVPSILADTCVISGNFSVQLLQLLNSLSFLGHPMVYILLIQKIEDFSGTVSDISFNMDIPDSPVRKISGYLQDHACKKAFLYSLKKKGIPRLCMI